MDDRQSRDEAIEPEKGQPAAEPEVQEPKKGSPEMGAMKVELDEKASLDALDNARERLKTRRQKDERRAPRDRGSKKAYVGPQKKSVKQTAMDSRRPSASDASSTQVRVKRILARVYKRGKLGRFELKSMLGRGSMGAVFRAQDEKLKREVALKVLPLYANHLNEDDWDVEQFIREARSAALIEHPNVTQVYEIGEEGNVHYIAMEYVAGGNLSKLVRAEGPLDYQDACMIVAYAADALAKAHDMGIVHRDIKPSNILLTTDGQVKITDFGLARIDDPDDNFSLPSELVGTPKYLAAEVCKGRPHSPKSDQYGLAACLWFLLVGKAPFNDPDPQKCMEKQVKAPLPDIRQLRPDLPDMLVNALEKALSKSPEQRFDNMSQFGEVCENIARADDLLSLATAVASVRTDSGVVRTSTIGTASIWGSGSEIGPGVRTSRKANSSGTLGASDKSSKSGKTAKSGKSGVTPRAQARNRERYLTMVITLMGIGLIASIGVAGFLIYLLINKP